MSKTNNLETEKYEFYWYQGEDIRRHPKNVTVKVRTIEGRDITEQNLGELKDYFRNMGKWETFVKAGKELLEDFGIGTKSEKEHEREFGFDKYEMDFERREEQLTVTIKLTPKESRRRTRGSTSSATVPPLEEIAQQIRNVPKWKTLRKAISELKSV